ncbi:hypothetical protein AVEN_110642-2 [Araneus ventricosus]|uniref:Nuclear receptor domain-containing protein n=1 Tax=Araneus ventricosus TaxID=182803 RepID=A0A4Y2ATH2_ARAVE|nr:hypothetical protein AVEN_110642-2 [Araneus ventricosus]
MAPLDMMNQLCKVCGEPAAGYHFGAFTCEGCKLRRFDYKEGKKGNRENLKDMHKVWNMKNKYRLCLDETELYLSENG